MVAFSRPGITLIEMAPTPVRHVAGIGRVDILNGKMIFTFYDFQPGPEGGAEAVIVERLAFDVRAVPDEVQFTLALLERVDIRRVCPRRLPEMH